MNENNYFNLNKSCLRNVENKICKIIVKKIENGLKSF